MSGATRIGRALVALVVAWGIGASLTSCERAEARPEPGETIRALPDAPAEDRARAMQVLAAMTSKVAAQSVPPVTGRQLIRFDTTETVLGVTERHEVWLEPDGLVMRRTVVTGGGNDHVFPAAGQWAADGHEAVSRAHDMLAKHGPSAVRPTREWLAKLPSDGAALRTVLADGAEIPGSIMSALDSYRKLLTEAWPMVQPAQRRGLYDALAAMPTVGAESTEPVDVGGRQVLAVYLYRDNDRYELLFDPRTGAAVGSRSGPQAWAFWQTSVVQW